MAFVNIMIHAVWGTKNRVHFLTDDLRPIIINHIKLNAKAKNIYIDRINGYKDHLHCLFSLNADMSIAQAMLLMKGESAFWINKNKLFDAKFEWGVGYYAASVSESSLENVRSYIDRQEEHHRKKVIHHEKFSDEQMA